MTEMQYLAKADYHAHESLRGGRWAPSVTVRGPDDWVCSAGQKNPDPGLDFSDNFVHGPAGVDRGRHADEHDR